MFTNKRIERSRDVHTSPYQLLCPENLTDKTPGLHVESSQYWTPKNHVTAEVEDFMCNNTTDTQISHIWTSFKG